MIVPRGTKHQGFCCSAMPRAPAGWVRWAPSASQVVAVAIQLHSVLRFGTGPQAAIFVWNSENAPKTRF